MTTTVEGMGRGPTHAFTTGSIMVDPLAGHLADIDQQVRAMMITQRVLRPALLVASPT